jgi:ketosteroid isomerase-like protein
MATDEDCVSPEKPTPPDPTGNQSGDLRENLDLEEFFHRLPSNLRWPKPNEEAVAAAVEAIQRLSANPGPEPSTVALPLSRRADSDSASCVGCEQLLVEGMRFCGNCGVPVPGPASGASGQTQSSETGQHHYHHHYHHFIPAPGVGAMWPAAEAGAPAPSSARPSGTHGKSSTGSRAEQAARQLVQDWAQACNTKHLDDLLELYSPDATVIRSNIPPVRSLIAVREFLFSLLEAGLGDVEMESLRTDVLGDIALELGRCKMLVPVAMGKRREERGKYLMVLVRQPTGAWKILADCWSSDLAVTSPGPPEANRKAADATSSARKLR